MIRAVARVDEQGLLRSFEARGHAGRASPGTDIVCAAFTVLARTAYTAMAGLPGLRVEGRARAEGMLDFTVEPLGAPERAGAVGMTLFLLEGLKGLVREFPAEVELRVEPTRRE